MKTFIQHGDCLTVPAPASGTVSGQLYKVGSIIGVAATTEAAGDPVVLKLDGVFGLPKVSAQAWAVGDPIYMNTTSRSLTNVSATGLVLVGVATDVAASGSATGACRLNGVAAPAAVA
jgi:predicted RecA/RadA family phage recombinase